MTSMPYLKTMASIPNFTEVDADELLDKSRKSLFYVTKNVVNIEHVEKACDVYGDDVNNMTSSRLFARFMSKFSFYYPGANQKEAGGPSLDAAWAYFENVTLARTYADVDQSNNNNDNVQVRAQIGDNRKTKLFPYWKTTQKDLKAFGISVRMYFSTIYLLSIFLFVAGLLNLPLINYFRTSNTYDSQGGEDGVDGSAVCFNTEWVDCESCNSDEYKNIFPEWRLDGENVQINSCNFEDWFVPGIFAWIASIGLVCAFGLSFHWIHRKTEIKYDEEIQTASDYSIKVTNPPPDALDPEEWKAFFDQFSDDEGVRCVTVAVDNAELIDTLIKRRKVLGQLKRMLPIGADPTDETIIEKVAKAKIELVPFWPTVKTKHAEVNKLNEKIRALVMERDYKAVAVFVTFETERAQRNTLHALSTGKLNIWGNVVDTSRFDGNTLRVDENADSTRLTSLEDLLRGDEKKKISIQLSAPPETSILFKGKVLRIAESAEPRDIRYRDLQVSSPVRFLKDICTKLILLFFISWSGFFVYKLSSINAELTATYIAITNVAVPKICEFINNFESHSTEGNRHKSLYVNITLFRCFNSAIAILLIMNFTETISVADSEDETGEGKSLIYSIYPVFFAELFTIPIIKLCDPVGNIRKHILAPRARSQEEMNSCMVGGKFNLAERYTDATKTIFVALFYAAIIPEAYFLGAAALMVHFLFGKFCLLRMCRSAPDIGFALARLSRNSFFSTILVVHLLFSAYFWSGYPYDQVCYNDENGGSYNFCNQDMLGSRIFPLPRFQPDDGKWMTPSQERLTSLYGWSSLVAICVAVVFFFKNSIIPSIAALFYSSYEPDGKDQEICFSDIKHLQEVAAYVPQFKENGFEYPLIACENVDQLDPDFLGWNDKFNGMDTHKLTNDMQVILDGRELLMEKQIFSIFKHWPPQTT